jgi:GT2 family glycosyltransferase
VDEGSGVGVMKTLSVIMPRYANTPEIADTTDKSLTALLANRDERFTTTITVVDDGSKIKMEPREGIRIIEHGQNRGIAVGWNTGWKANPMADFYCWINADCIVTPNWSFPLVVAAEQMDCISFPYTNGKKWNKHGISGWCFLTSRQNAERIGPFDETFVPAQYEDTDWFHRAVYEQKIALVNLPSSNVLHLGSKGGVSQVDRFQWLHLANRYRYCWKHNVNPEGSPPFYKAPLPDVDLEDVD